MATRRLRIGVAGLGRAFTLMLPTFRAHPGVRLVAAADARPEARERFAGEFGVRTCADVDELVADKDVEAVYVATPHQVHAAHVLAAVHAGKHVLVEKPFAVTLDEAHAMVAASEAAGVHVVVGHSHSFDAPIARAREILASGELGAVRMVSAMYFTDFLYRPRRPEELDTAQGGGVIFSQAAHQVDIVRLLGGGRVATVRAMTGNWDPARPTEGAYSALLGFEDGAFATLTYAGYGHYDGDELMGGVNEIGRPKDPAAHGAMRRALGAVADAAAEARAKAARTYGGASYRETAPATAHEHFGFVLASCERGDVRPLPDGVAVYGDLDRRFEPLGPPAIPRREVIDELRAAAVDGVRPLHDARWGLASLEVCVAILRSAREGREVHLAHQVAVEGP